MWSLFRRNKNTGIAGVGRVGEDIAVQYLRTKGYAIVERNYFNHWGRRLGEIDIIAEKSGAVVFVEVKTRFVNGDEEVFPELNITPDKLRKLEKIAAYYLRERKWQSRRYHYDALAVRVHRMTGRSEVRHLEHIFY